jgi:short-subunit dehydrogenase
VTSLDWTDQWVLVTGASAGIGREFATQLAAKGANLVLCSRNEQRLNVLADELGTQVRVVAADLQTDAGVDRLFEQLDALDVRVDHVVNNAGMGGAGRFEQQRVQAHREMVALNCTAVMRITHRFLPEFLERGAGGFLQVASVSAFQPVPYMAVYAASKAFVLHMSLGIAEEIAGTGVRMTALCPGSVPTEFQARAGYSLEGWTKKHNMTADRVVAEGLRAYARGDWKCIPGFGNSFQTFLQRFVPLKVTTKAAAVVMRRSGRDKLQGAGG